MLSEDPEKLFYFCFTLQLSVAVVVRSRCAVISLSGVEHIQ